MKKGIRIIGIVLAALLLLFFAACLIAPKFAGRYIEGHFRMDRKKNSNRRYFFQPVPFYSAD